VGAHVDIGAVEFQAGPLVTSINDSGAGSLRVAAGYSTNNATITFAPNLSGQTILLTSGQIVLSKNVTIDGSALANPVQINGNSNSAVFIVNSDVTATLNSLTITNGYNDGYGGGLLTAGTLTLDRCSILGNYATYGGGIFQSAGILVVSNCLVANNRSADCGGIYTYIGATQFLWNSTVTGNSAADTGGGVKTYFGNIIIGNATIVGNAAVNYGGGINNFGGSLALSNSIVAANNAPVSTNLSGSFTGANNLTNGNPLLAPLGYYGGPTQTMPPLAGSPAIDAGSDVVASFLATDQRGLPRLSGQHVDLGAVEVQIASSAPALTGASWLNLGTPPVPAFQFGFGGLSYGSFTVFATTNAGSPFNTWSNLGPAIETPLGSGQFQFNDPQAANSPQRYYRVRSP
jgi:hypothetical protein